MPTLEPKVLIDVAKINKKPERQTNKAYKKCKKANNGMFLAVFMPSYRIKYNITRFFNTQNTLSEKKNVSLHKCKLNCAHLALPLQ